MMNTAIGIMIAAYLGFWAFRYYKGNKAEWAEATVTIVIAVLLFLAWLVPQLPGMR